MAPSHALNLHTIQSLLKESLSGAIVDITEHFNAFLSTRDPESLHQYRVNIRFARSLCKEFGAFMEVHRKKLFDEKLKLLQQETNAMRDIDVFLEAIMAYKNRLSQEALTEAEALQTHLNEEKQKAYDAFCEHYAMGNDILFKLQIVSHDERLCLVKAQEKLLKHLKVILKERMKKIARLSKKLTLDAPDAQFHKLRLQYKRLRYTCDAVHLKEFAKSFKPIQTAFGNVQDKHAQIERIEQYQKKHHGRFEPLIALLREEMHHDKETCIQLSTTQRLEALAEDLHKILHIQKKQ